jgi:putative membrane protein insertion efficiency factor
MKIMAQLLIWVIRGYQILLSPFFGQQCRFYPTCSAYATQAINRHGAIKGSYYALRRILRCHPWHVGGSDPIP